MLVPINAEQQDAQQANQIGEGLPQKPDTSRHGISRHGISQEDILSAIPSSYRNKARTLLDYVIKNSQLSWNERGEIVLGDGTIQGSHIIDLLKYSLYPYKHFTPVGFDQFKSTLQAINTPRSLSRQTGAGQLLPPPGLPARGKEKHKSTWVWHKM